MSNVPVSTSNSSLPNVVKWNDPLPSFVPTHLKPANWCGRQWAKITTLDGKNACSKMCQVILRIIPAIFLALATVFAGVVGLIGSCCSSKSVEYSIVDMEDALNPEMLQLLKVLHAYVTKEKAEEIIDGLDIPDALLKEINQKVSAIHSQTLTASDVKEMIKGVAVPVILEQRDSMRRQIRKIQAELVEQEKQDVMTAAERKGEEKAKVDPVVVFGQPKARVSSKEGIAEFAVASQAKVNAFQRMVHGFGRTAGTPAVSDVVKAVFLDGLKNIQAADVMKQIPSEMLQELTKNAPPGFSPLLLNVVPDYVCKVVLPAIVSAVEPALLDSSAKAKVAAWARDVNSVKFQISETKTGDEVVPVFKVIVA